MIDLIQPHFLIMEPKAAPPRCIFFKLTYKLFLSNFSISFSLIFFLAFLSSAPAAILNLDNNNIITPAAVNAVFYHQEIEMHSSSGERRRKLLSEPGSWPPRCMSRCGQCTPCKPVHVPVPPGTPVTTEYYPVAWRCKCGNKLYMP